MKKSEVKWREVVRAEKGVHYFGNIFNFVIYVFLLLRLYIFIVMCDLLFVFCFIVLYSVSWRCFERCLVADVLCVYLVTNKCTTAVILWYFPCYYLRGIQLRM